MLVVLGGDNIGQKRNRMCKCGRTGLKYRWYKHSYETILKMIST